MTRETALGAIRCGLGIIAGLLVLLQALAPVSAHDAARSTPLGQQSADSTQWLRGADPAAAAQAWQEVTGGSNAASREQESRALEPGKPVERELAGSEVHSYQFTLTSGQYLHIAVDQAGIDVVVVLRGPDGMQLVEMDGLSGVVGAEELVWEAATSGGYVLEVQARAKQASKGRYIVRLGYAAEATGRERARIAGQRLYMDGQRARQEGGGAGLERAAQKYEEALVKWREAREERWERRTLNNLGTVYFDLSQYDKAREFHEQALAISREANDRRDEGLALNGVGFAYENLGQYEKALESFEQALTIMREIKDRTGEARALNNLGTVYSYLSQYQKAGAYYQQVLAISREIKSRYGEGLTLANLGVVYRNLGQYEQARDHYEQALGIMRETQDKFGEGVTLSNLGNVYRDLHQYEKARDCYEQALAINREIKNRRGEGRTLGGLGDVHVNLRQHDKARDYYEQALAISREIKDRSGEGWALNNLGDVDHTLGQYEKARDHHEQALAISRETKERSREGLTLYDIARVERDRGNLSESRAHVQAALAITESLRTGIAGQELRTSYFASVQNYYELYIDLLMRLHHGRPLEGLALAAFEASEHARARSLLDLLSEARADIRQGAEPALIEREREVRQRLNAAAERQVRALGGPHTDDQAIAAAKEVAALTSELQQIEGQIRVTSPRYAALTQPQPLSLRELQDQVLDGDTLLLEYALGEERSYLWAVTPTSLVSYELPKRSDIESAAQQLTALSTARSQSRSGESAGQQRTRFAQADSQWPAAAARLSDMLLAPVASHLTAKRVLIVADGALQYVPFAALPIPKRAHAETDASTDAVPLITEHEIVSLPSASVLAVLRRELAARKPAEKAVAVLADPVFDAEDRRLAGGTTTQTQHATSAPGEEMPSELERALRDVGLTAAVSSQDGKRVDVNRDGLRLPRLLFSRQEAEAILAVAPAGMSMKALDFQSSRETATSPELSQYRIVHFATHGLLDGVHPELSGLVLSLVNDRGQPQDGFLRLHDVYNLNLPAELVVLSACQTGLGKQIKGEGLVGLTRGFMYAGAARVVASLWKVDDVATAELMKSFYRGMLVEGLRPAAALRAAQIAMWKQRRWQAPYYWAAFILQGEWR